MWLRVKITTGSTEEDPASQEGYHLGLRWWGKTKRVFYIIDTPVSFCSCVEWSLTDYLGFLTFLLGVMIALQN